MAIVQQSGSSTSVGWIILDPNEIYRSTMTCGGASLDGTEPTDPEWKRL